MVEVSEVFVSDEVTRTFSFVAFFYLKWFHSGTLVFK
jgi:hypothetical protein